MAQWLYLLNLNFLKEECQILIIFGMPSMIKMEGSKNPAKKFEHFKSRSSSQGKKAQRRRDEVLYKKQVAPAKSEFNP